MGLVSKPETKLVCGRNAHKFTVSLDVHLIREVQWNTGAFDSLFIDPNQKSILLSLFESHQHRVSKDMDRIDRKGKGLMIRLLG